MLVWLGIPVTTLSCREKKVHHAGMKFGPKNPSPLRETTGELIIKVRTIYMKAQGSYKQAFLI